MIPFYFQDARSGTSQEVETPSVPPGSRQEVYLDDESREAFMELQQKIVSTSQRLKLSNMQIDQLTSQNKRAKLVEAELAGVPTTTKVYQGVGRMFMLEPMEKIKSSLEVKVKNNQEKIAEIESNKTILEKHLEENQKNMREFIASKQRNTWESELNES